MKGLRFSRHHGEAFRTPEWSTAIHVYVRPGLWPKVLQLLRNLVNREEKVNV